LPNQTNNLSRDYKEAHMLPLYETDELGAVLRVDFPSTEATTRMKT